MPRHGPDVAGNAVRSGALLLPHGRARSRGAPLGSSRCLLHERTELATHPPGTALDRWPAQVDLDERGTELATHPPGSALDRWPAQVDLDERAPIPSFLLSSNENAIRQSPGQTMRAEVRVQFLPSRGACPTAFQQRCVSNCVSNCVLSNCVPACLIPSLKRGALPVVSWNEFSQDHVDVAIGPRGATRSRGHFPAAAGCDRGAADRRHGHIRTYPAGVPTPADTNPPGPRTRRCTSRHHHPLRRRALREMNAASPPGIDSSARRSSRRLPTRGAIACAAGSPPLPCRALP
jgi:hypothetical protein